MHLCPVKTGHRDVFPAVESHGDENRFLFNGLYLSGMLVAR